MMAPGRWDDDDDQSLHLLEAQHDINQYNAEKMEGFDIES